MQRIFQWFFLGFGVLFVLFMLLIVGIIKFPRKYDTLNTEPPLVIAHRGASGYLPAHTLAGYMLAIEQGADIIEPDLVMTKDGVLICRHEPMLSMSTNVKDFPEFADRKKWKKVSGWNYNDWFVSDFTLEEIKKLGVIQSTTYRPQEYNGIYQVPTFDEVIQLAKIKSAELGKTIGICPELKHPTFHNDANLTIIETLLDTLDREGWNHKDSPIYIQSTEVATLQYIRSRSTVKLMQLCLGFSVDVAGKVGTTGIRNQPYDFVVSKDNRTFTDLTTDDGLDFVKSYADVIGVWSPFILPYTFQDFNNDTKPDDLNGDGVIDNRDKIALPPTDLVDRAHKRDLFIHVFALKDEVSSLLSNYEGDPIKEYEALFKLGVDGVFSDFPGTAFVAREKYSWED